MLHTKNDPLIHFINELTRFRDILMIYSDNKVFRTAVKI